MKKVPFLIALSCFSLAVSAQQNDFLNISDYLKKKAKEKKAVAKPLDFFKPSLQNLWKQETITCNGKFSHKLANGAIVYILPQDNMPCVTMKINMYDISNGYKESENSSSFTFYKKKATDIHPAIQLIK